MTDTDSTELRQKRRRQMYLQMRIDELQAELKALRDERVALGKELGKAREE